MSTTARFLTWNVVIWVAAGSATRDVRADAAEWDAAIRQFEIQDQLHPPSPGGILFVGSSSIRLWDVDGTLPGYAILNRGFGGSQMSDVLHHMDRIVLHYQPRLVVLYEGDNDIAAGEAAVAVADEFRQFAERLQEKLPHTRLIYLSIKPSPARWQLYPQMKQANAAIADYCRQHDRCQFVDVSQVMLNELGTPRPELFAEDGLHLNIEGYRRWAALVRPLLDYSP